MLFPMQVFSTHEYGANLEDGHLCPVCREGRLAIEEGVIEKLRCARCGGIYKEGWRRHHFSVDVPKAMHGSLIERLGGFFRTIQGYAKPPKLNDVEGAAPHLGDFVLDIDREDLAQAKLAAKAMLGFLDHLAPGQCRVYMSGSKGFHVVLPWQTLGAVPSAELTTLEYRALAAAIQRETGHAPDFKIYSPGRMLRMPDSWHPKTGLYKVELEYDEIDEGEAWAEFPRGVINHERPRLSPMLHDLYLSAREESSSPVIEGGGLAFRFDGVNADSKTPPCVSSILTDGSPYGGTRHDTYLILARYWRASGLSVEEALKAGREHARSEDPNSRASHREKVVDMENVVRHTYARGRGFSCKGPQSLGICSDTCPVKQVSSHPLMRLIGMPA